MRNLDLMWQVAGFLNSLAVPWVLGGDFQMGPAAMIAGPPLQAMGATLVAPMGALKAHVGKVARTRPSTIFWCAGR